MPQMSPLMWFSLFILFSITMILFNQMNFYSFKPNIIKSTKKNNNKKKEPNLEMKTNLFSTFDPSANSFNISLNWTSTFIGLLLIPSMFWLTSSRINIMWNKNKFNST